MQLTSGVNVFNHVTSKDGHFEQLS